MVFDLDDIDIETLVDLDTARDDTEEDLVGSDLHQDAITEAHAGIAAYAREQGLPWYVSKQVMIIAPVPGETDWRPSPDVYVALDVPPGPRSSYNAFAEPFPRFIVEVLSSTFVNRDLNTKRRMYRVAGAREYLIFDPTGEWLEDLRVRAWRLPVAEADQPIPEWEQWEPDAAGTWHSEVLGLGFRVEGMLLRAVRPDGSLMPTRQELDILPRRVAELEEENRRLRGECG